METEARRRDGRGRELKNGAVPVLFHFATDELHTAAGFIRREKTLLRIKILGAGGEPSRFFRQPGAFRVTFHATLLPMGALK